MSYLYLINSKESSYHFANDFESRFDARLLAYDMDKVKHCYGTFLFEIDELRFQESRQFLNNLQLDYIYSKEPITIPKLVVFDMDSTLIPIEVIDELASFADKKQQVAKVTELAMQGKLDFDQSLRQRVACLKGLPESVIQELAATLKFNPGVKDFCHYLTERNAQVAIASGGFVPFARALQQQVQFRYIKANQLEIIDSRLTGKVVGPIINAQEKAKSLSLWAEELSLGTSDCMAVGDGANDLLMLEQAGIGVAYHAKQKVNEAATAVLKYSSMAALIDIFEFAKSQN